MIVYGDTFQTKRNIAYDNAAENSLEPSNDNAITSAEENTKVAVIHEVLCRTESPTEADG